MELQRKQDLSIVYWLRDLLSASPFINITSEYDTSELAIPKIIVQTDETFGRPFELGSRELLLRRMYFIDIYASNISQRNDYAYKIFNALKDRIPVYNYDEGFPPFVPSQIGNFLMDSIKITPLTIDPTLLDVMYWRSVVTYNAIYEIKN